MARSTKSGKPRKQSAESKERQAISADLKRLITLINKGNTKEGLTSEEYKEMRNLQALLSEALADYERREREGTLSSQDERLLQNLRQTSPSWDKRRMKGYDPSRMNVTTSQGGKGNTSNFKRGGGYRKPVSIATQVGSAVDNSFTFLYGDAGGYNSFSTFKPGYTPAKYRRKQQQAARRRKKFFDNAEKRVGGAVSGAVSGFFGRAKDAAKETAHNVGFVMDDAGSAAEGAGSRIRDFFHHARRKYDEAKVRRKMARQAEKIRGMDKFDGNEEPLPASPTYVSPYTRVKNGKQEHVSGYTRDNVKDSRR